MQKNKYVKTFEKGIDRLNAAQKLAVNSIEGPVMVVAGPGTGKTQILALRIGNILKHTDTKPSEILCLTYTDAGQIQMRQRLLSFIGPTAYQVQIHTYHSFCNQVIQENRTYFSQREELQPASDLEEIEMLRALIKALPEDHLFKKAEWFPAGLAKNIKGLYSLIKTEAWDIQQLTAASETEIAQWAHKKSSTSKSRALKGQQKFQAAIDCFQPFQEKMREEGRYNFDDMIVWVLRAFQTQTDLLAHYQEKFQYFLVDEYQDTNGAQNEILELLVDYWERPNLFVVGDDDQAIYRFQGANMQNLIDAYRKYDPTVIVLSENYRSAPAILTAAESLIEHNLNRLTNEIENVTKKLKAAGPFATLNDPPQVYAYENIGHEEAGIIDKIERLIDAHVPLEQIAVIYKQHKQAEHLIETLEKRNIPVWAKKKVNILQEPIIVCIRRILEYIDFEYRAPDQADRALFEIMHYRFFGLDVRMVSKIAMHCWEQRPNIALRDILSNEEHLSALGIEMPERYIGFEQQIAHWIDTYPLVTLIRFIEKIWHEAKIMQEVFTSEHSTYLLQELVTWFRFIEKESRKKPNIRIHDILDLVMRMEENGLPLEMQHTVRSKKAIRFLTAHASKGLEFDHVFIIGLTDKTWQAKSSKVYGFSLPKSLVASSKENTEEDERRLLYVAMTRARKSLHLSFYRDDENDRLQGMSQFIEEIRKQTALDIQDIAFEEQLLSKYFGDLLAPVAYSIQTIDHDLIDRALERFNMTPSKLNDYLVCPRSFYFNHILRVPRAPNRYLSFGNAIHAALESAVRIEEKSHAPMLAQMLDAFGKSMVFNEYGFTEEEFEYYTILGGSVLNEYLKSKFPIWKAATKLIPEYKVQSIMYRTVPITGKIDLIEGYRNNRYKIIDYKTGKPANARNAHKAPDQKNPLGGKYWRQMVMYAILLRNDPNQSFVLDEGEISFLQPENNGKLRNYPIAVSEDDIEIVSQQLVESYRKIKAHDFEKLCEEPNCYWCQFVKNDYVFSQSERTEAQLEAEAESAMDWEGGQLQLNF